MQWLFLRDLFFFLALLWFCIIKFWFAVHALQAPIILQISQSAHNRLGYKKKKKSFHTY